MSRRTRIAYLLGLLATGVCTTSTARADDAVSNAREIGYEGARLYEDGEYAGAEAKFDQAFAALKAPTLGLWYARTLAKRGKLTEAARTYQEVIQLKVKSGRIKEQRQAQAEAAVDYAELSSRIPELTLSAKGNTEGVTFVLDGAPLAPDSFSKPIQLNPGAHAVKATRGSKELSWDVSLAESTKTTTELDLTPLTRVDPPVAPSAAPSPMPKVAPPSMSADSTRATSNPTKLAGWVFLGLGGVATAVGATTAIVTASKKSELDDSGECANNLCYPEQRDLRESYNSMRLVSGASFLVGALALGTGATFLLTAPKPRQPGVEAHAQLGVGTFNVVGAF